MRFFFFTYTLSSLFYFLSCVLFNSLSLNDLAWFPIACKWVVLVKLTELLFGSAGREFVFCFVCFFPPPNSLHSAVLQSDAKDSVDYIAEFLLLLSSTFTASRILLATPPPSKWGGLGWAKAGAVTWPGQQTPADQKKVPYHMSSCLVLRCWGRGEKRRHLWLKQHPL